MKRIEFSDLIKIIGKLDWGERKVLRSYLASFHRKASNYQPKTLQLLELLMSNKQLRREDAKQVICPESSETTFDKIVVRLREKAIESLELDVNIRKREKYSPSFSAKLSVRKRLNQADILYSKGLLQEALKLYSLAINQCEKYELYEELIGLLTLVRNIKSIREGSQEFQKYNESILFYEKCKTAVEKSRLIYHEITAKVEFKGSPEYYLEELKKAINQIEKEYIECKSDTIFYFLYRLRTYYHKGKREYEQIEFLSETLLDRILNSPAIKRKLRIGIVNIVLCDSSFHTWDFDKALNYATNAKVYFAINTYNYLYAMEHEFAALFYLGELLKAEKKIIELLELTDQRETAFRYDLRMYLKAAVSFLLGKNEETHKALQDTPELYKDKEGWNIAARILHILNLIERDKLDSAERNIEYMRRHIKVTMELKSVSSRNMLILQLLLKLVNESFDFKKVKKERKEMLQLLASDDDRYRWEILSPEYVIFHKWFEAKTLKKPYPTTFNQQEVAISVYT